MFHSMAKHTARSVKISVIILNWNRPADTLNAVQTTLQQEFDDFEIVVWDNASTDDSRDVLSRAFRGEPRVRLLWSDANYGVAGGRNRAFREARGEILLSLDSDAVIETPDGLARSARVLEAEPDIGAISFEVRRPDGHLMWPFARAASAWRNRQFDTIRVDGCSFATRRTLFEQIGGFPEHFSPYGAEDLYYAFQLIGAGYRVVYFPDVKVIHAFTPKARQERQFAMHVRNMLWVPLELFPFPHNILRSLAQSYYLWREARDSGLSKAWKEGVRESILEYQSKRRHPLSRRHWRTLRKLMREDKEMGKQEPA